MIPRNRHRHKRRGTISTQFAEGGLKNHPSRFRTQRACARSPGSVLSRAKVREHLGPHEPAPAHGSTASRRDGRPRRPGTCHREIASRTLQTGDSLASGLPTWSARTRWPGHLHRRRPVVTAMAGDQWSLHPSQRYGHLGAALAASVARAAPATLAARVVAAPAATRAGIVQELRYHLGERLVPRNACDSQVQPPIARGDRQARQRANPCHWQRQHH